MVKIRKNSGGTSVMMKITYPSYDFRIKEEAGKEWVFDPIRKQWVRLTPEEWVRQHFLQYLVQEKKYPASLIAVEKEIELGELRKRFDIVVYKDQAPWMVVECKDTTTSLTEAVFRQALHYNIVLKAPFIVVTNGSYTQGYLVENGRLAELETLPPY